MRDLVSEMDVRRCRAWVIVYVAVKTAHSHWVQANIELCGTHANFHCNIQLWNLEARR